jgi:hypothetical protein
MRDLSHSNHFPKQLKGQKSKEKWKKVNADVTMTSPNLFNDADMSEEGVDKWRPVTGQMWQTWTNVEWTCGE